MQIDLSAPRLFMSLLLLLNLWPALAEAGERKNELLISWGVGKQPDTEQHNSQLALDYNFYQFRRTLRSELSLGTGYTRLETDAASDTRIDAWSVYPQLTLWPLNPALSGSFFFVRALGPTYISENRLGARQQKKHFTFQAQVGIGYRQPLGNNEALLLQLSWKHFSNANWFTTNDGIDLPFVLSVGLAY